MEILFSFKSHSYLSESGQIWSQNLHFRQVGLGAWQALLMIEVNHVDAALIWSILSSFAFPWAIKNQSDLENQSYLPIWREEGDEEDSKDGTTSSIDGVQ